MADGAKLLTVPKNGQVCLGRKYAGRNARLEFINENQAVITFGKFVPDDMATFFTPEAKEKLEAFGEYENSEPVEGSLEELGLKTDEQG